MADLTSDDLRGERIDYTAQRLLLSAAPTDPLELFDDWLADAFAAKADGTIAEPSAMQLATIENDGAQLRPSVRTVLLKGFDDRGFSFFTNYSSRKALAIVQHPQVALQLHWAPFYRAVRIEGRAERVPAAESDAYFATRPRGSQLGAWTSPQSHLLTSDDELAGRYAEVEQQFEGRDVPRPPFWGGYLVRPGVIEFWQGQPSRLHDRIRYRLVEGEWRRERLAP